MVLRILIIAQVACVALLGGAARLTFISSSARWWSESFTALGFYPVWAGFPLAIWYASRRQALPVWKRWLLRGIEVALGFAALIAILPAV